MADTEAFDFVCNELERDSSLDRLEARGTVRIALREAGLDPATVTQHQMTVMVEKILPAQLTARGVDGADDLCSSLARGLKTLETTGDSPETPDAVFQRLGGGA